MLFPPEILDAIIQHAINDSNTLCNLCLVSTSFAPQAQRVLYRNINVAGGKDAVVSSGWLLDFPRAAELLKTLTMRNRALAKHVRKLYHHNYYYNQYYWCLVKQCLQLMINLKCLIFTSVDMPFSGLFDNCTFRLEVFGCDSLCQDAESRHQITRFLSSQTDLTSLYIWGCWDSDRPLIEARDFPKLEALSGDRRTIESILPGRSLVTQLIWMPSEDEDLSTPPFMITSELSCIRIFALGGFYERPNLRSFIPYLSSVQILRLYGDSPKLILTDECTLAVELLNLRIFIWTAGFAASVQWHRFRGKMDRHNQDVLVEILFQKSTALEKVYIHTSELNLEMGLPVRPKTDSQYYLCWERNLPNPSVVSLRDVIAAHDIISWYT